MIIALFPNEEKKNSFELSKKIISFLQQRKIEVVSEDEKAKFLNIKEISKIIKQ